MTLQTVMRLLLLLFVGSFATGLATHLGAPRTPTRFWRAMRLVHVAFGYATAFFVLIHVLGELGAVNMEGYQSLRARLERPRAQPAGRETRPRAEVPPALEVPGEPVAMDLAAVMNDNATKAAKVQAALDIEDFDGVVRFAAGLAEDVELLGRYVPRDGSPEAWKKHVASIKSRLQTLKSAAEKNEADASAQALAEVKAACGNCHREFR